MKSIILSDLDGTLANLHHRRHLVERPRMPGIGVLETSAQIAARMAWKPDWDTFHEQCVFDTPKQRVIDTVMALKKAIGAELWVVSGRSSAVLEQSKAWLQANGVDYEKIVMRPESLYTPDDKLKEEWLLGKFDGDRLVRPPVIPIKRVHSVFDDRDRVVAMWRRHGLTCFQVAPGAF
jgi:hypothetical protein